MANTHVRDLEQTMQEAKETARDVANQAGHKAAAAMKSATETVRDVASQAGQKAEQATTALGSTMASMGQALRDRGPRQGMLGTATGAVADRLEDSGEYLRDQGLSGIGQDLRRLVGRNPGAAVLTAIALGFFLGRMTRS